MLCSWLGLLVSGMDCLQAELQSHSNSSSVVTGQSRFNILMALFSHDAFKADWSIPVSVTPALPVLTCSYHKYNQKPKPLKFDICTDRPVPWPFRWPCFPCDGQDRVRVWEAVDLPLTDCCMGIVSVPSTYGTDPFGWYSTAFASLIWMSCHLPLPTGSGIILRRHAVTAPMVPCARHGWGVRLGCWWCS